MSKMKQLVELTVRGKSWVEFSNLFSRLNDGNLRMYNFGTNLIQLHTDLDQATERFDNENVEEDFDGFRGRIEPVNIELEEALSTSISDYHEGLYEFTHLDDTELELFDKEFHPLNVEVVESVEIVKAIGPEILKSREELKLLVKSGDYGKCPYGPTYAKGLFSVMNTISTVVISVSNLVGKVGGIFSYFDTDGPLQRVEGSREKALLVLKEVESKDKVTTAAVARYAVEPFFKTAGNIASGGIGNHYEEIRDGLLSLPPTDENLLALATNETVNFWNQEPGLAGVVGSLMSTESRFEILKKCRDESWINALKSGEKESWEELKKKK